jgi:uncharacterized membrane protein YfcA
LTFNDPTVLYLFGSGIGGGIIAGTLGVGGGVVYVAIFTSFLRGYLEPQLSGDSLVKYAIANAAFSLSFAGFTASVSHMIRRSFYLGPVLLLGLGGTIGAVGMTLLLSAVVYSSRAFAVVFSVLLLPVILRMIFVKTHDSGLHERNIPGYYLPTGFAAGVVMALSGLGGGVVMVPVLAGLFRMPIKKAISISLGALTMTGIGLTVYNIVSSSMPAGNGATIGPILLPMALPVVCGVLIGAPIGVELSKRLNPIVIRALFVVACLFVMTKLFIEFVL